MKIILLICIILFFSLNFSYAENLNCDTIKIDIQKYPVYKEKIDNFFKKVSEKSEKIRQKYYTKLDILTYGYLRKIDAKKQKKLYAEVGYFSCENNRILRWNRYDIIQGHYGFEIEKVIKDFWNNFVVKLTKNHCLLYKENRLFYSENHVWNSYCPFSQVEEWKNGIYILIKKWNWYSKLVKLNNEWKAEKQLYISEGNIKWVIIKIELMTQRRVKLYMWDKTKKIIDLNNF